MKKFVLFVALTAMVLALAACGGNVEEYTPAPPYTPVENIAEPPEQTVQPAPPQETAGITHQFENLGFSVTFPATWEGKYGLREFSVEEYFGGTRHFVEVYHTATREEILSDSGFEYGGRFFTLGVSPRTGYNYDDAPLIASRTIFFAMTGGNTYFAAFPTGGEHGDDPVNEAEYMEMIGHWEPSHWDFLIDSFALLDGGGVLPSIVGSWVTDGQIEMRLGYDGTGAFYNGDLIDHPDFMFEDGLVVDFTWIARADRLYFNFGGNRGEEYMEFHLTDEYLTMVGFWDALTLERRDT